jgi:hypothetical protein
VRPACCVLSRLEPALAQAPFLGREVLIAKVQEIERLLDPVLSLKRSRWPQIDLQVPAHESLRDLFPFGNILLFS